MQTIHKAADRGTGEHGWLSSRHTFSFANFHDPRRMGFQNLRVINEDHVAPGRGFGTHSHQNMEIVTWVLDGALQHEDSMGHKSTLRAGEFQRMTAGSGITHSEQNASTSEPVHFYQIWIQPSEAGLQPTWDELRAEEIDIADGVQCLASDRSEESSRLLNAHASVSIGRLAAGKELEVPLHRNFAWLQMTRGELDVNSETLAAGDGAAIESDAQLLLQSKTDSEFLLFGLGS